MQPQLWERGEGKKLSLKNSISQTIQASQRKAVMCADIKTTRVTFILDRRVTIRSVRKAEFKNFALLHTALSASQ